MSTAPPTSSPYPSISRSNFRSQLRTRLPDFINHGFFSAAEVGEKVPWSIDKYGFRDLWRDKSQGGVGTRGLFVSGPDAGKPVVIGIVGTGAPKEHPDLDGQIIEAKDFSGSNFGPWDMNGHETHVGGIIAAKYGNGLGVSGAAPDAKLYYAKGLGDNGTGTDQMIADAIFHLADSGRVHLINLSLGSDMHSPAIQAAIDYAVSKGIPVIAAAGNSGGKVNCPGNLPNVICVGASDENQQIAAFSCFGPEMDFAAPGVRILSTFVQNGVATYAELSGTSMASPWVSAVVALMIAADPTMSRDPESIIKRLQVKAWDKGQHGNDYYYGWGIVNPVGAVVAPPDGPQGQPGGGSGGNGAGGSADACGCVLRALAGLMSGKAA